MASDRPEWLQARDSVRPTALLDRVAEVCPVHSSAQRVMELARSESAGVHDVVDAIARDPALAAEVLRIANSPLFGQTQPVTDLHRAVVVIGMQELHTMAAAMSMLAAFQSDEELALKLHGTSVLSGTLAKLLARETRAADPTQAFLCGLLCEIGAMACLAVDPTGYLHVWEVAEGSAEQRARLERDRYGTTSEQIGSRLLARNNLPEDVAAAVGASVLLDPSELNPLEGVTLFSRLVAPLLVRAANDQDPALLYSEIPALAEAYGFGTVSQRRLIELCVQGAAAAELSLRGEGRLLDDTPESASTSQTRAVEKKTSRVAVFMVVGAAAAAGIAIVLTFLMR